MLLYILIIVIIILILIEAIYHIIFNKKIDIVNKHIIITGGSSGIGLEMACEFVKHGAKVTIISRNIKKLENAKNYIKDECNLKDIDKKIYIESATVTDPKNIKNAIENGISKLGSCYMLVTSAGFSIPGYFIEQSLNDFHDQMDVNYWGTFHSIRAVLPSMIQQGEGGHIMMIGSVASYIGMIGYSSYCPSKWAIRGLAECLRSELQGFDIRVSIAYPPDTQTPGFDRENLTKPRELQAILPPDEAYTPAVVAKMFVDRALRGYYHINGPDFGSSLLQTTMVGVSPRCSYVLENLVFAPIGNIGATFYMWMSDFHAKKYGKRVLEEVCSKRL